MKKFLALVSMITCIFGLTACGSSEEYSAHQIENISNAENVAVEYVNFISRYATEDMIATFSEYTYDEITYDLQSAGASIDGYTFMNALISFEDAIGDMGQIVSVGEATATVDDSQIIVSVEVFGENKDALAEIIVSNDFFMKLESASLNIESSMGELMSKAALNTLIGMGTVFVVLILICFIIYGFAVIPKIQAFFAKKKEKKQESVKTTGIENAVAQIVNQEELSYDTELVAVIAAAIAAYEGEASTDGFVVRSIRKVNRNRR